MSTVQTFYLTAFTLKDLGSLQLRVVLRALEFGSGFVLAFGRDWTRITEQS